MCEELPGSLESDRSTNSSSESRNFSKVPQKN